MVHRIDSLHAGHLSVFSLQRSHKYRWLHGRVTMFRRLVKQFKHFELRYNNLVSCRNDSSFVSSTLSTLPKVPRRKQTVRPTVLQSIRSLQLPSSPPAAPKKEKRLKNVDITPIPFVWEHQNWVEEVNYLADYVRSNFTKHKPEWILDMKDLSYLKNLYEL